MANTSGAIGIVGTLANSQTGVGSYGERIPIQISAGTLANALFEFKVIGDPGASSGVDYREQFQVRVFESSGGTVVIGPSASVLIFEAMTIGYRLTLHTYEITWRLGTYVAPNHLADGEIHVYMDNVLLLSATGLALGRPGIDGWNGATIGPCGGITSIYLRDVDERCPGFGHAVDVEPFESGNVERLCGSDTNMLYNTNFKDATDAETFADVGGSWSRSTTHDPSLSGGFIVSSTGARIGQEFTGPLSPPPPHPPPPCTCDPPPSSPPKLPPPIPPRPPKTPPIIGAQLACLGGGLVPIQADLVYVENWWSL